MELDPDNSIRDKMEIMVTLDEKDEFGEYKLCNNKSDKKDEQSIRRMSEQEQDDKKLIGFIKDQQNSGICQGKAINVFITHPKNDLEKFNEIDVEIPKKDRKKFEITDVNDSGKNSVIMIKDKIAGIKAVIKDIQEDYGISYVHGIKLQKSNKEINEQIQKDIEKPNSNWVRFKFTFLNMIVSSSFLANYNMIGFYTLVILGISSFLTPTCMFKTYTGWLYECTHAMPLLKLCDGIYMGRHEGNLKQEDECWRMLQDFVRSPELVKAITGSNCKGDVDSKLDFLNDQ